jgi:hypothetical protein
MHVGHVEVEHHQIHWRYGQPLDRLKTAPGLVERHVSELPKRGHDHPAHGRRVVDDQDGPHFFESIVGRRRA